MSLFSFHRYVNIQVQAGTRDCGLFAIANALSIVNGEEPSKKMFDQKTMQRDLVRDFDNGVLRSFNGRKVTRKRRSCNDVTIKVYCHCRGLEEGEMICATSGTTGSVAMRMPSTLKSQRTLNGLACYTAWLFKLILLI